MNEELKVVISAQIDKLKSEVSKAKKTLKDFAKEGTKDFGAINDEFQKYGDAAKKGLAVAGAAMVGVTTALLSLSASTREYRQQQAQLSSAFETAGGSAAQATTTYNDLYRVLGDTGKATEAAAQLANLTTEQAALTEWTTICQGVYATFGESIPIESLAEGAAEAARTGTMTAGLTDALVWAGVAEDEFNAKLQACNTEAEREALIRQTLTGIYGEAAAAYEQNAASILAQNEAQAKLDASMAAMGEAIEPINTALTELGAEILADLTPYIQEFAENHLPAITAALSGVGEAIGQVISFIANNWELISTLATVIAAICVALTVFSTVMTVVNAVMMASPVTWIVLAIVAAIAALVAIIVLVIMYWDEIKATTIAVWNAIVNAVKTAVNAVINWFNNMKQKISDTIDKVKTAVSTKFEAIKTAITNKVQAIKDGAVDKFNQIKEGITSKVEAAKEAVTSKFEAIKSGISEKITAAKNTATSIFDALKSGISSKIEAIKSIVTSVFNAIKSAITNPIETAKGIISTAIEAMRKLFNFTWELPRIKLPHFSISGKFSLNPPQAPKFNISWYKLGGIFDNPTLFPLGGGIGGLGEDGAEAIVPLEKNTKWLDRLASMLNEKQGAGAPIVLQVDGKTFAEVSCASINQLTRQRGSLPLKLV